MAGLSAHQNKEQFSFRRGAGKPAGLIGVGCHDDEAVGGFIFQPLTCLAALGRSPQNRHAFCQDLRRTLLLVSVPSRQDNVDELSGGEKLDG